MSLRPYVPRLTLEPTIVKLPGTPCDYQFSGYKLRGFDNAAEREIAGRMLNAFHVVNEWRFIRMINLFYSIGRECQAIQNGTLNPDDAPESIFTEHAHDRTIVAGMFRAQEIVKLMTIKQILGMSGDDQTINQVFWPTTEFILRLQRNVVR